MGDMTLKQKFLSVSVTCAGFTLHRLRLRDMGTLILAVDCRGEGREGRGGAGEEGGKGSEGRGDTTNKLY